jgi:uncharacterized protein (DUF362 family)
MHYRITRRRFLHTASAGLALAAVAPSLHAQTPKAKTRLVMVQNAQATDENGLGKPDTVAAMVQQAVCELTGNGDNTQAWASLFKPTDVVGLKVNLRGGTHLSTQPCVVNAIIDGLTAAGVAPNNIIVWDAWTKELKPAGFMQNVSTEGVRYFCTDHAVPSAGMKEDRTKIREAYSDDPVKVHDKTVYFTRIMTDTITALVNVPMVKDHRIAGVTCAMKNHYGSILTPKDLHGNACDPYLAELSAAPVIRDKTRLILVDGLRALYNGGPRDNPQYHWNLNAVIAGTDPVAVDSLAGRLLDEKREEKEMDPVMPKAHYIQTAAGLGIGTNDPQEIDFRTVS